MKTDSKHQKITLEYILNKQSYTMTKLKKLKLINAISNYFNIKKLI